MGWIVAPASICAGCKLVHSHETFCAPVPLQRAIAESLDAERGDIEAHMREATELMRRNAERLTAALEAHLPGVRAFMPGGGYFVMADISQFAPPAGAPPAGGFTDVQFVEWLLAECETFCMVRGRRRTSVRAVYRSASPAAGRHGADPWPCDRSGERVVSDPRPPHRRLASAQPGNMFFDMEGRASTPYVRFAISKSSEVVDEAIARMRRAVGAA